MTCATVTMVTGKWRSKHIVNDIQTYNIGVVSGEMVFISACVEYSYVLVRDMLSVLDAFV